MNLFQEQAPLVIFIGIVLVLASAVVLAYFQSSKTRPERVRRRASWIAAFASGIVAFFATMGVAIPILDDFRNPSVGFRSALIGAVIAWVICLCVWGITVRCILTALRKDSPS
jgi:cytochrome bd-type quinol oxidase subunit 2